VLSQEQVEEIVVLRRVRTKHLATESTAVKFVEPWMWWLISFDRKEVSAMMVQ